MPGKLRLQISVSIDGYVAGPNQSTDDPLGEGGEQLHEWVLKTAHWRAQHGREGGEENVSSEISAQMFENVGASIMGRKMFGGGPGPWSEDPPWKGWWGDEPPYHHPVFVLTHHEREPLEMEGGTTFHFVTDGIESALERAREAAGEKDIALMGGAETCNEYLAAGLVDEMLLCVAPVILGDGERLFADASPRAVELVGAVDGPDASHLRYRFS